jgi:hypothetical protein
MVESRTASHAQPEWNFVSILIGYANIEVLNNFLTGTENLFVRFHVSLNKYNLRERK